MTEMRSASSGSLPTTMQAAVIKATHKNARSYIEFWFALTGGWYCDFGSNSKSPRNDQLVELRPKVERELRLLVDAWINSGFSLKVERPFTRSLSDTELASIDRYLDGKTFRPSIKFRAGTNLDQKYAITRRSDVLVPRGLKRKLLENERVEKKLLIEQSALDIGLSTCTPPRGGEDSETYCVDEAMRLFLSLLNCAGLRFRIMRCGRCSKYAFREPRPHYKRGWHCEDCSKSAATRVDTYDKREAVQERRLWLAAEALNSHNKLVLKPKEHYLVNIANRMNKSLKPVDRRSRNWVSLHETEIDRRAKELREKRKI